MPQVELRAPRANALSTPLLSWGLSHILLGSVVTSAFWWCPILLGEHGYGLESSEEHAWNTQTPWMREPAVGGSALPGE